MSNSWLGPKGKIVVVTGAVGDMGTIYRRICQTMR